MQEATATLTGFMIVFVCAGLLIAGAAVPLILRRIKPNRWYGFRTDKTLGDERVWYEANAYSGWLALWLGVVLSTSSAVLHFVPAIGDSLATYGFVCGALFTVGLLTLTVLSLRKAEDL
ncbi:MAG: SdpI family protein [Gemmatimonadetes bacterium]|nr:SdpI family protein [Gemmatimonadota bacterium]